MGCLNSDGRFSHWFGNIHLSGPCNRSCYFCIGQHMMTLDKLNTLNAWPLPGIDEFLKECRAKGVRTIYLTGTNTDPLLYRHVYKLGSRVRDIGMVFGVRTNGIGNLMRWDAFDCGSLTICSTDHEINQAMMGGPPPNLERLLGDPTDTRDIKINIVLGPENRFDVTRTLNELGRFGPRRVNLREPYGQPHQGDPLEWLGTRVKELRYGMPVYEWGPLGVCYWNVHYCEVESVNLYATGRVSLTYPITKGCDDDGIVLDQTKFTGGRVREQWV